MAVFQHISGLKPKKNKFNLSSGNAGTMELGELIPVYVNELVPGDRVRLNVSSIIRLQPLKSPMLQKLVLKFEAFFVPIRIIDEKFKDYYTGGKDGKNDYQLPLVNDIWDFETHSFTGERGSIFFEKYSLADYFGLPINTEFGGTGDPDNTCTPLAYPFFAYSKIWKDYYVDENVSNFSDMEDGDLFQSLKNQVLVRSYKKDYFTSALPFQQRGEPGAFEWALGDVLGNVHAEWDNPILVRSRGAVAFKSDTTADSAHDLNPSFGILSSPASFGSPNPTYAPSLTTFKPLSINSYTNFDNGVLDSYGDSTNAYAGAIGLKGIDYSYIVNGTTTKYLHTAGLNENKLVGGDVGGSIGFNVADLRYQVQLQKYNERNARAGWRYNEYIFAHFGQHTPDKTIDRVQFIGSAKSEISISEIPQTSASNDVSDQGNLAGRGIGTIAVNLGTYKAEEPGYIFVLQSIVPAVTYASQGVSRMFTRRTRFDFYTPEFAHLSEQPVLKRELYYKGDIVDDNDVFGYQGIYDEYRYKSSIAVADFRDNMSYWKMAREFSDTPELNDDFLQINGGDSYLTAPFAYTGSDFKHYIYDTFIDVLAFRPMPLTAEPGFVDHF